MTMNKSLIYIILATSVSTACQDEADPAPEAVTATYNQRFDVRLSQRATLPQAQSPDVVLQVEDIDDMRAPSTIIAQRTGDIAITVGVTPTGAPKQTVTLFLSIDRQKSDSAAVQTAAGRYDVRFLNLLPLDKYETVAEKDKIVQLRVTRR